MDDQKQQPANSQDEMEAVKAREELRRRGSLYALRVQRDLGSFACGLCGAVRANLRRMVDHLERCHSAELMEMDAARFRF